MTSALAESALHRRFLLLAPIIAIALIGSETGSPPQPGASPSVSVSPSASPSDPLAVAKRAIQKAYEAEEVYKVDNLVYAAGVGDELAALKTNEHAVAWGTQVIVQFPNQEAVGAEVLILRAPLADGTSLCLSEVGEVEDAGIYYARAPIGKPCPPRKRHMPGWVQDDADAGWR